MTLQFVVNGRVMDAQAIKAAAPKAPPRASTALKTVQQRDQAKESLGFIVLGYSPEHWAQRIADRELALELYANDSTKNKNPGSLDEFTVKWVAKNKPKKARSKPYEIESSADECAALLRKAGWLHVRVEEILKG